ncbi:phosphorothioated DNA-binding restriction endonuclease [candidate division CSSED10-310 bacterium]|uniref:Phosphorothioated DNA-binding restriction endonuclease n=1 Tax=candidate division CSSED10-310 bacterium TaxID=2855610 RepID=A0ABV6YXP3_UNCC1
MSERTRILEKFRTINVWKKHGLRAPHKPLLILYSIGQLLTHKARFISYDEVDDKLKNLLIEFGPTRKSYHPEFPFYRLQNDGIWHLKNADNLVLTSSGDAKKSELLRFNVTGGFSSDIVNHLRNDLELTKEIIQDILEKNFTFSIHEDIIQAVGLDTVISEFTLKIDQKFKQNILQAYDFNCAVCGLQIKLDNIPIALEAAHIKWRQAGGPDEVSNGLALCSLHHKLFARGAFSFSENYEIIVSHRAKGSQGFTEWLQNYHGHKLRSPNQEIYLPQDIYRQWHLKEVFKGYFE